MDDTPNEYRKSIENEFKNISEFRSCEVTFSIDGGEIQEKIRNEENKNRSLILGSAWERDLAKDIGADLLIISPPIAYRLVLNCGYAGYKGGLRVVEDIYNTVLDTYR